MIILIRGHAFHYEMENLTRLFFPDERIRAVKDASEELSETYIVTEMRTGAEKNDIRVAGLSNGETIEKSAAVPLIGLNPEEQDKQCELRMANLLFDLLCEMTGYRPLWGILTGVRPIKLLRSKIAQYGEASAADYFQKELRVSAEKIQLALDCQRNENVLLEKSRPDSFSLYIAIPFCPSRCAYCSFVSQSIERAGKLIPRYLELLLEEVAETGRVAKELSLRLETVYIGGGTPTILSAAQLSALIESVFRNFDTAHMAEFTVEAGRPDTITPEKLDAMKKQGVTRISINPQTLSDTVLATIGRAHTTEQTLTAYADARQAGFSNINMDIIAGLPDDTPESFEATLSGILRLSPESVTVHALSMKKSARLVTGERTETLSGAVAAAMVEMSIRRLYAAGYRPYYLYRQSKMLGNLENVGWSKPDFEGYYNAYIMDETHTILACGAGGVTKLRQPVGDHIARIFNYKFPYEYCNRFEEMIARKKGVKEFYEKFGQLLYTLHRPSGTDQSDGLQSAHRADSPD